MTEDELTESADWGRLRSLTETIMSAIASGDPELEDSLNLQITDLLEEMRTRFGDLPLLLETRGDFEQDDNKAIEFYRLAMSAPTKHGDDRASLRIALAHRLYAVEGGTPEVARLINGIRPSDLDEPEVSNLRELQKSIAGNSSSEPEG